MFLHTGCVVDNTEAVVVVLEVREVIEEGSNELLLARSLSDTGLLEDVEAERLEEEEEESTVLELGVELISGDANEDDDAPWLLEVKLPSSEEDEAAKIEERVLVVSLELDVG
jgi:hypothetical protein